MTNAQDVGAKVGTLTSVAAFILILLIAAACCSAFNRANLLTFHIDLVKKEREKRDAKRTLAAAEHEQRDNIRCDSELFAN